LVEPGLSPGIHNKGAKYNKGGFNIQHWMYAATRVLNMKWEDTYFKWEDWTPLAPRWQQPWVKHFLRIDWSSLQHMGHETPVL